MLASLCHKPIAEKRRFDYYFLMNRARNRRPDRRSPKSVATATRWRVLLAADSIVPDYPSMIRGCIDAAQQTGRIEVFYRGFPGGSLRGEVVAAGAGVKGILCRSGVPADARFLRQQRCPVVVMEQDPIAGLPLVRADNAAIGRLGAEFLLAKGHRRFGYWGVGGAPYSDQREKGFAEAIHRSGSEWVPCRLPREGAVGPQIVRIQEQWLSSVTRPIAVLVDTTTHARQFVAMCQQLGYAVPEEVAILSCDNDELLCSAIHPSISGIDQNMRRVGYEAAMLMIRLLDGETVPLDPVFIPPAGVVERQSTDAFAVDDRRLALALNRIRTDAAAGKISVRDVAHAAGLGRRALQMRFRDQLGRTVQQEIARVRAAHARRLLLTTELPMSQVAAHCGYESAPVFTRAFRRATGTTPLSYRRQRDGNG